MPRGFDGERIVAFARQLVHRRQIAQPHSPKATEDGRAGKAGTASMVGVAGAALAMVDRRLREMLGALVEAGQQCPSLQLDNGLPLVLAREGPN